MPRELFRYRQKLIDHHSSEKNRMQNALTVSNIALASVLTDAFGKSASAIIDYILECDVFDIEHCKFLLKCKAKEKADDVVKSIIGYELSGDQSVKMKVCRKHYDYINECTTLLIKLSQTCLNLTTNSLNLLPLFPELTSVTYIIAEIGTDMTVFTSSKRLCSWAGLTLQNNESAGKKKSVHVSRVGVYLKPLLAQCANAAIKDKKNPYFKFKYDRIKKRRGHKRAIIAITRMILTCIYHKFLKQECNNPSHTDYCDIPEELYKEIVGNTLKMQ